MTITSSPPIRTSPTVMTVGSCLNVRLASLYGSVIRSTSWTPSSSSISALSGCPCPTAPSTVRVTPVDRCTSMPISTRRATTCSIWASVARSSITTTMASVSEKGAVPLFHSLLRKRGTAPFSARLRFRGFVLAVNQSPLQPPRLVDDPLEQPRDRVGAERAFGRDAADVREHLLLALGLIDLDPELLLDPADLAGDARALVQQAHEHFVDAVDVVAQIVKRGH